MAANVNCPICKNAVAVTTDADGKLSAWCQTCQRKINITRKNNDAASVVAKPAVARPVSTPRHVEERPAARSQSRSPTRRPKADRRDDDDDPKSNAMLMWIVGGVGAFALLLSLFIGAYFLLQNDAPAPVVVQNNDVGSNDPVQPAITPSTINNVWTRKTGTPTAIDQSNVEELTRYSPLGNTNSPVLGLGQEWVSMPADANQYGFSVKLPPGTSFNAESSMDSTTEQRFTLFKAAANDCNYRVEIFKLPDGVQVTPKDLNEGAYRAWIFSASFGLSAAIDGLPTFAASRAKGDIQYCVYVQKESTLYSFMIVSKDRSVLNQNLGRFLRSIDLNGNRDIQVAKATPNDTEGDPTLLDPGKMDQKPTPPTPPTPLPPEPKPFKEFNLAATTPNKLVTIKSAEPWMTGNYQKPEPKSTFPDTTPQRATTVTGQVLKNINEKDAKDITFNYTLQDLQWTEKGGLTSIECAAGPVFSRPWIFFLHQHDAENVEQTKRTEVPDNPYFVNGRRTEAMPHYEPNTEMFYVVSSMMSSALHTNRPFGEYTNVLRQVHMKDGQKKKPLEFTGNIAQYRVSPSGRWILVEVDEYQYPGTRIIRRSPIFPGKKEKRYLAICDANTLKVTKTVPLPNAMGQLAIVFRKDESALLIMGDAGVDFHSTQSLVMQTLTVDGKTKSLDIPNLPNDLSTISHSKTFRGVVLPDGENMIVGPVGRSGQCLRFRLKDGAVTFEEKSEPCSDKTVSQPDFALLPDSKELLLGDGFPVKMSEFFPEMSK